MSNGTQAIEFLRDNSMHADSLDFFETLESFKDEMKRGLAGEASSLYMLPTFISDEGEIPTDKKVIVLDAGGTNLRVALCRFSSEKGFETLHFEHTQMPGFGHPVDKDEFFDAIAARVLPIANESDTIGFCFSYAARMTPERDGRSLGMAKELVVRGINGELVCDNLSRALGRLGVPKKKYVLLNDTVAAMLGARAVYPSDKCDGYAGFILGTGVNLCYSDLCSKITKEPSLAGQQGKMIINIESGNFAKLARGGIDIRFDKFSALPGEQLAEKMLSGAYLSRLALATLKAAANQGLLSETTAQNLLALKDFSMRELNIYLGRDAEDDFREFVIEDDEFVRTLLHGLIARAAKVAVLMLAGAFSFAGCGNDPALPTCVCVEGTTYYKTPVLREEIDKCISEYLVGKLGIHTQLVNVADATLVGTALAALLNA